MYSARFGVKTQPGGRPRKCSTSIAALIVGTGMENRPHSAQGIRKSQSGDRSHALQSESAQRRLFCFGLRAIYRRFKILEVRNGRQANRRGVVAAASGRRGNHAIVIGGPRPSLTARSRPTLPATRSRTFSHAVGRTHEIHRSSRRACGLSSGFGLAALH